MSTSLLFAAASEAGGHHLPMPAWAFGLLALLVFLGLLLFVWMFRHTAQTMIEGGHGPVQHSGHGAHGAASHATAQGAPTQASHRMSGPGASPAAEGRAR